MTNVVQKDDFDEEAELWLKCSHYILLVGCKTQSKVLSLLNFKFMDEYAGNVTRAF